MKKSTLKQKIITTLITWALLHSVPPAFSLSTKAIDSQTGLVKGAETTCFQIKDVIHENEPFYGRYKIIVKTDTALHPAGEHLELSVNFSIVPKPAADGIHCYQLSEAGPGKVLISSAEAK